LHSFRTRCILGPITNLDFRSEDTREKIAAEIKQLENKTVVRCDLIKPTLDLVITFENGLRLETFSFDNTDAEHWKLFVGGHFKTGQSGPVQNQPL